MGNFSPDVARWSPSGATDEGSGSPWGAEFGLALKDGGLDRAAHLRGDDAALAALVARPGARAIGLQGGEPLVEGPSDTLRLARLRLDDARLGPARVGQGLLFLGLEGGEGLWAAAVPPAASPADPASPGEDLRPADLRGAMTALSARDGEVAATARALLGWHESHGFCARCGAPSSVAHAGWQRDCPACGAHHFPRTDPVVIMLVVRGNECLLGRSPGWPPGMFSCLAGFMEPGETLEAAVRREVVEETGVRVGPVSFVASQPWPFPASLMLGCRAEALSGEITIDPHEIEAAMWVSRERMARILAGRDEAVRAPRAGPIAGALLQAWVRGALA